MPVTVHIIANSLMERRVRDMTSCEHSSLSKTGWIWPIMLHQTDSAARATDIVNGFSGADGGKRPGHNHFSTRYFEIDTTALRSLWLRQPVVLRIYPLPSHRAA